MNTHKPFVVILTSAPHPDLSLKWRPDVNYFPDLERAAWYVDQEWPDRLDVTVMSTEEAEAYGYIHQHGV